MISVRRISLRALTIGSVAALGLLTALLLAVAAATIKSAASASQRKSLARVVAVASAEVMRQLDEKTFALGSSVQTRPEFRAALAERLRTGASADLLSALNDPFEHGFVGVRQVDLVGVRVYDPMLAPVAERAAAAPLPRGLPAALRKLAAGRSGVDRLKAVSALWRGPRGPLYSVLLPVGGLHVLGYLEMVVDPAFNLKDVARMTRLSIDLLDAEGRQLASLDSAAAHSDRETLQVDYVLPATDGQPAFRFVAHEDITELRDDVRATIVSLLAGIGALIGLALVAGIMFFDRFLFRPVGDLQSSMERYASGDLTPGAHRPMLKEFNALAGAFDNMARQLAEKIDELNRLSCTDRLTGLSNRHHFDVTLAAEWARARRTRRPLSLLLIDIDHFKLYNDHYGHPAGDACLRSVCLVLQTAARRPTDMAARYGGEEFAILLPDTPTTGARAIAEGAMADLARMRIPHAASPTNQRVTISIGIATWSADDERAPDSLIAAADAMLYRAKHAGRNRIEVEGGQD